jgi:hypothetical protein
VSVRAGLTTASERTDPMGAEGNRQKGKAEQAHPPMNRTERPPQHPIKYSRHEYNTEHDFGLNEIRSLVDTSRLQDLSHDPRHRR